MYHTEIKTKQVVKQFLSMMDRQLQRYLQDL